MKTKKINCDMCGKQFERDVKTVLRNIRMGFKNYCSKKCLSDSRIGNCNNSIGNPNIINFSDNKRDDLTPFRYFMVMIRTRNKERKKEYNVNAKYLKEVWDGQKGICPFTQWKMQLPHSSEGWRRENKQITRASIDRIDNSKGYVKGNVRFVCVMANFARNKFDDEDVKMFCKAVADNA